MFRIFRKICFYRGRNNIGKLTKCLDWDLHYGSHIKQLEAQQRQGRKVRALDNRPKLLLHSLFIWNAFWDLHGGRTQGFGPSPIQLTEIIAWCDLFEVETSDRLEMFRFIRAMDQVYFKFYSERSKEDGKQSGSRNKK